MKIRGQKSGSGHITRITPSWAAKRYATRVFLMKMAQAKSSKKTVDPEKHTILIEIDPDAISRTQNDKRAGNRSFCIHRNHGTLQHQRNSSQSASFLL